MHIFVITITGKFMTLVVQSRDTINNIKAKIQDSKGIPPDEQKLTLISGEVLEDDKTIAYYNIQKNQALRLDYRLWGTIKVKQLTGKEFEIDIDPTDTMYTIKKRYREKEGLPTDLQRLIYKGNVLEDDYTVKDYNIEDGSVVHMVLELGPPKWYRRNLQ